MVTMFRTIRNFITMAYLMAGKLEPRPDSRLANHSARTGCCLLHSGRNRLEGRQWLNQSFNSNLEPFILI
jgi:hypothetical protein